MVHTIAAAVSTNKRNLSSLRSTRISQARCSVTSVLVPNQRTSRPAPSRIGRARDRNQRYWPSLPRSGKVSSHGSLAAMAARKRSVACSTWSGWWTPRQPHPCISASVVPV